DHRLVSSSSLVPANDPTLYFVNAGMVQFKDVFVGEQTRDYTRATSSQKCLRVSGKHNDLEAVGRTPKHHTFFEMLGNFSFGDYFKREAIGYAWEFLTKEMGLDPERMVATVFAGEDGVPPDEDAFDFWRKDIGLPEERIFQLGKADNFWSMGEVGPCGPCAEIHLMADPTVSMGDALAAGGPAVDDRWVEIWNLVFMQFERCVDGTLAPLKRTGVDTGMGLERLTALVNGHTSTYDTDLLRPIIESVAAMAGKDYGSNEESDISLRVIADHARATAFCIADGVFPEKGGREYVLRRIMRRAIRHGKLLGFEDPFFHRVCLQVVEQMGDVYPELVDRREIIAKLVAAEEASFRRTLGRGLEKLQRAVTKARQASSSGLGDDFVGDLYATDGFPVDLTRIIAEEHGLAVDEEAAMRWVQKTHGAGDTRVGEAAVATIHKTLEEELKQSEFLGYTETRATGEIVALVKDGERVDSLAPGDTGEIVVDRTPFYGRAGGQAGDTGLIRGKEGDFIVEDALKPGGQLTVHKGRLEGKTLKVGETVDLIVNEERRNRIALNHSATHLLHHVLREFLGTHVAQKGSEVTSSHLRFDFSHFQAMSVDEITEVERRVNALIRANARAETVVESFDAARKSGAMALFGEKYGDEVRVVTIGRTRELCGGTHVSRAGDIGLFRLVSEEALAMGVRRIVAVVGDHAMELTQTRHAELQQLAGILKVGPAQLNERVERLLAQLKEREREVTTLKKKLVTGGGESDLMNQVQDVGDIKLLTTHIGKMADPKVMREAGDTLRDRLQSGVVVLAGEHGDKATLMVMVSKDLTDRVHAGKLVKKLAEVVGGRGGGRADMAQAGGPDVSKLKEALDLVPSLLSM
ncbi:MAG: alanine--tRNA ligase, partial [Deltaproteobacteria bacterium]|nr:alanine--tRNA ligase [Deltaproteobacteria bacterium]